MKQARDDDVAEAHVGKRLLAALGMLGRKSGTMPLRNFTGIPLFTGEEVNAFLERYNSVADDFEVSPAERVRGLLYYVQERGPKNVLQYIKALPEWQNRDWPGMQAALKRTFPDEAESKPTFSIHNLRYVISKDRRIDNLKQLSDYYFEYKIIADYLLDIEDITQKEHGSLFFRGLPSHMRYSLEGKERLLASQSRGSTPRSRNLQLDKIYSDCQDILKNEGIYSDANSNVEKATVIPTATSMPQNIARPRSSAELQNDRDVTSLIKMLEDLRVDFASLKQTVQTNAPYNGNNAPQGGFNDRPNNRNWHDGNRGRQNNATGYNNGPPVSGANATPVRPPRRCIYDGCDRPKHECEALREDTAKGIVKVEQGSGHLLYPNGDRVQFAAGAMMSLVRNRASALANSNTNAITAQTQSIELKSYRPPSISAPDVQYINNIGRTRVSFEDEYEVEEKHGLSDNDANNNRDTRRQRLSIPEVVIEQRTNRSTPRAGPSSQTQGSSLNRSTATINNTPLRREAAMVMDDADMEESDEAEGPRRRPRGTAEKRVPGSTLWAPVNERAGSQDALINRVVEQILDTNIPISISAVLGMSTQASKKMNEFLHRKRVPVPTTRPFNVKSAHVNEAAHNVLDDSEEDIEGEFTPPLYTHAIGRVKVKINGQDITAIIDTGSEINVMPKKTWARLGCHLREDGKHTMVSANSQASLLLGIAEDLDISIGQLRASAHFFVTEKATWDLLLGMPVLSQLRAKIWFEQRSLWLRLTDDEGHVVRIRSTLAADNRNRTYVPGSVAQNVATIQVQKEDEEIETLLTSFSPTHFPPAPPSSPRFTELPDEEMDSIVIKQEEAEPTVGSAPYSQRELDAMRRDPVDGPFEMSDTESELQAREHISPIPRNMAQLDLTNEASWHLVEDRYIDYDSDIPVDTDYSRSTSPTESELEEVNHTDAQGSTISANSPYEGIYIDNLTDEVSTRLDDEQREIIERYIEEAETQHQVNTHSAGGFQVHNIRLKKDIDHKDVDSPFYIPIDMAGIYHISEAGYDSNVDIPKTDNEAELPYTLGGIVEDTSCHIVGEDFIILKHEDLENILFDYISPGKVGLRFHDDKVIISVKAAMNLGRRGFMACSDTSMKVKVFHPSYYTGTTHVDATAIIPSVTISIGDAYKFTTDVFVVPEVDYINGYDVIIGSLLLLQPDAISGQRVIGYEEDGAYKIHKKDIADTYKISRKHYTDSLQILYDFGGKRVLRPLGNTVVSAPFGDELLLPWAFFPFARHSYISERTLVSMFFTYEPAAHSIEYFGDLHNQYMVTIVGYITIPLRFNGLIQGLFRMAVVRGNMPEEIVMNGPGMLEGMDFDHQNILIDVPVGNTEVRYFAIPARKELWVSRADGTHFYMEVRAHSDIQTSDALTDYGPVYRDGDSDTNNDLAIKIEECDTGADALCFEDSQETDSSLGLGSYVDLDLTDKDINSSGYIDKDINGMKETDIGIALFTNCLQVEDMQPQLMAHECNTKYKPVAKKTKPLNRPLPAKYSKQTYFRPALSRDPYTTPLLTHPPEFTYTAKLTRERIEAMHFGPDGWLNDHERNLILHVLQLREAALAFDKSEKGCLKSTYAADYVIPIVDHVPWQDKSIPISKALYPKVIELLKDEIAAGDLEPSSAPYSTRWFVVQKKDGRIRKVDGAESLNKLCIKDSGVPPNIDDFQVAFSGRVSYSLIDMLSGYDQRRLAVQSRDLTTIRTPLGLLRRTALPQGYTNAVAEFQRSMTHVLAEDIPDVVEVFIDDIGLKGPKSDYNDEAIEENKDIRKWVWEHAVLLERILYRLEEAGLTASGKKLIAITPALEIIGTVISKDGRQIAPSKLNKISTWPNPCPNVSSLRGFLGLVGFVRPFIKNFAIDDYPLRQLLGKNKVFKWTQECTEAVEKLKASAGSSGVLHPIDYESGREIILAVDSSYIATGIVLMQIDENGERLPVRFESLGFNDRESRYSQPKLELCGVYKALRKMRLHIFGVKFTLEVDARSLIQMLNAPELPNAPMTRWLAYIKLFDFELRHVPATQHTLPDALSRKEWVDGDDEPYDADEVADEDLEVWNFQYREGGGGQALPLLNRVNIIESLYSDKPEWLQLAKYLESGRMPEDMPTEDRKQILRRADVFFLRNGRLWKRSKRGIPQEVILNEKEQRNILEAVHEHGGHRGRDACHAHLRDRVWWPKMYETIKSHVRSCDQCQRRHHGREKEQSRPTMPSRLFQKVGIDLVHLGEGSGPFPYLVVARDDLSNWVEARHLGSKHANTVRKFLEEDIVCRYGPVLEWITTDGGGETKKETAAYLKRLHIPIVRSAPYHPQANGMIERGHGPLVEACLKMAGARKTEWHKYLPTALWADRVTTRRTTGRAPFEVLYGAAPLLPIDQEYETWLFTEWRKDMTTAELLEARMKQIARRDEDLVVAMEKLAKSRKDSIMYLDRKMAHRLRAPLKPGTLVLQHDTKLEKQWSHRVKDRWFGPFVVEGQHERGSYYLREVDGTPRATPVAASRLRRFFPRGKRIIDEDLQRPGPPDFVDPIPLPHIDDRHNNDGNNIEDIAEDLANVEIDRNADIPADIDDDELDNWVTWNEDARRRHYPRPGEELSDDEDSIEVMPSRAGQAFQPIHDIDFREQARPMSR